MGEIRLFAGSYVPTNWAFCQGQILEIRYNSALYAILGNTYGGNAPYTFALPDLRGRVPMGVNPDFSLGNAGGAPSVALTNIHLPIHDHRINASVRVGVGMADAREPDGNYVAETPSTPTEKNFLYCSNPPTTISHKMANGFVKGTTSTDGGHPLSVIQPYLALNYIICVQGIFPDRP